MSTNAKDAVTVAQNAVNGNTTINTWCMTKYGKNPTIFVGIDPLKPPPFSGNCPMIIICFGIRAREADQRYRAHSVRIGVAVEDKDNRQARTGQIVRFLGCDDLDDFADLVEKEITRALNAAGYASTQDPDIEDECIPPYFVGRWSYLIRCPSRLN